MAVAVRFKNMHDYDLLWYWNDGSYAGLYFGDLKAYDNVVTNAYISNEFFFLKKSNKVEVARITVKKSKHLYLIGFEKPSSKKEKKLYEETRAEVNFMNEYFNKTGIPWLSYYPRDAPILFMHPANFLGEKQSIHTHVGYFESRLTQNSEPIELNLTVISTSPKVFFLKKLLSNFEVEHIISIGKEKLRKSRVGTGKFGYTSSERTSSNGWLDRNHSHVLNTLFNRFADVLGMERKQLFTKSGCTESLQFVEYQEGQQYHPHHDFSYSGRPEQRFSTLLIYLQMPRRGGETAFLKAHDNRGLKVTPNAGDAVLFYNMLEDGNGDDKSLHAGMQVLEGTKYICNLWTWDPKLPV